MYNNFIALYAYGDYDLYDVSKAMQLLTAR